MEAEAPIGGKLVRDRIPEIIRASGSEPRVRVAPPDEYADRLRAKLLEEATEFVEGGTLEELADVLEVVDTLARELGADHEQLDKVRLEERRTRGGFDRRLVWYGYDTPS